MAQMNLNIVTPTGSVVNTQVMEVSVPGSAGQFGVYPMHQSALVLLGGGLLTYEGMDEKGELLIRGGVAEISHESVRILTDYAFAPGDADTEEAAEMLKSADAALESDEFLNEDKLNRIATDRGYAESVLAYAGR